MTKPFVFLVFFLFLAAPTFGQDYFSRWEVFGTVGYGRTWDDEGDIGRGINLGGGLGVRATPKLGFEGSVNRVRHSRTFDFSGVTFKGTGTFVSANALYHFTESGVQPFVTGGVGVVHRTDSSSAIGLEPPRPSISASGFAYNFGVGMKIFANKHISVRPEFKIFFGDLSDQDLIDPVFRVVQGSIGISYHW